LLNFLNRQTFQPRGNKHFSRGINGNISSKDGKNDTWKTSRWKLGRYFHSESIIEPEASGNSLAHELTFPSKKSYLHCMEKWLSCSVGLPATSLISNHSVQCSFIHLFFNHAVCVHINFRCRSRACLIRYLLYAQPELLRISISGSLNATLNAVIRVSARR